MFLFEPALINNSTFDLTVLEEGKYENRDLIRDWNTT